MSKQSTRSSTRSWLIPVVVLAVAAVLIAGVLVLNRDSDAPTANVDQPAGAPDAPTEVQGPEQPDFSMAERRDEADLMAAGPVDAPVVMVVFSDYQCPFCAQWSAETLPLMMEHVEAGDLRIEWRDVNIFGAESERASRASYAAAQQGSFWEYHDALFPDGQIRSVRELSDEALVDMAGQMGLDTDQFSSDLQSEVTAEEIAENAELGLDLGAHSTPTFLLGGEPIVGAQPSEVFQDAFATALAETE